MKLHALTAGLLLALPSMLCAATKPLEGLVNYETAHVHPIDLTADKQTLLAVNIAAHRLEVWSLASGTPVWRGAVRTGLDPVSVRSRNATEAWVVNQVSDTVSLVNLQSMTVIATLNTDNEPADVVFANGRAFVSCSDANSVNVFNLSNLAAAPQKVAIAGEEPRALEVSADGTRVYAAIFESGNSSTIVSGGQSVLAGNAVSRSDSPYGGQNPPPNRGSLFDPPIGSGVLRTPVSLIVKKDAQGRWMDDNNGNWTPFVSGSLASTSGRVTGWDLADNDVAIIDTSALSVTYQRRLMNICMAIGVNPANGQVSVVGTEATNQIRFEPNLNGRFLRVNHASFAPGGSATIRDLNPHLNYATPTVPLAQRTLSVGDPRGVAWRQNGQRMFVTGMGSDNVAVYDASGARVGTFTVGQGPTGIVLNDAAARGYVMNKFDGSISVIDLNAQSELQRVTFDDPTPRIIKEGRPLLYNTHLTSGSGMVSCASCHVDGKTDRLSWDLGDPRGPNVNVATASNSNGAATGGTTTVSSMKGPMLTQTLQDIMKHPTLHWRGDKGNLAGFNPAFVGLMGADSQITATDMQKFGAFLNTIHLPPNPYRRIDDTRPNSVVMGDGSTATSSSMNSLRGTNSRNNNCMQCHLGQGTSTRNRGSNPELGQAFVASAWAPFYKRMGFWPKRTGISTSGFGFFHDGADALGGAARTDSAEKQTDMLAELMSLEGPTGPLRNGEVRQDTHAGVGKQITLSGAVTAAQQAVLDQFVSIANSSSFASLVAHGRIGGVSRAFQLTGGTAFQSDRAAQQFTLAQLTASAAGGASLTFTLVAEGTERRLSIDADNNGVLDGDQNANQAPSFAGPGNQTTVRGTPVSLQLSATDAENNSLTWSISGLPSGLSMSTGGRITGTPVADGVSNVTASVSDGVNPAVSRTFTWTVLVPPPVQPNDWWKLDDTAGSVAANASSGRNGAHENGVLINQPGARTATLGAAFYDGIDDQTVLPVLNNTSSSMSIVLWVRRSGVQNEVAQMLFANSAQTNAGIGFGPNHTLRYHWSWTHWAFAPSPELVVPDNQWCLVALVIQPDRGTLYLRTPSGLSSGVNIAPHALQAFEAATYLGVDAGRPSRRFRGWLDDVRVHYSALTAQNIESIWQAAAAGSANRAPVVAQPAAQTNARGAIVSLALSANDPDGDAVTWSATGLPAGLGISSTGVISGTVSLSAAASNNVTVSARDASSTGSASFVWTTVAPGSTTLTPVDHWRFDETSGAFAVNAARTLNGAHQGGVVINAPGATASLGRGAFYDGADDVTRVAAPGYSGNTLSFALWVRRNGSQAPFTGLISSFGVDVDAALGLGAANELRYRWTGTHYLFEPAPPLTLPDNQWALAALAVDPAGATLYLRTAAGLQSARYNAPQLVEKFTSDLLIGTDASRSGRSFRGWLDDVRVYNSAITSSDVEALWAAAQAGSGNRAPSIARPADQNSSRSAAVSLQIQATDPDGNPLTFSASGLPGGLTINAAAGLISGTVSPSAAAVNNVTVTVNDGQLNSSTSFAWTIAATTALPQADDRWALDETGGTTAANSVRSLAGTHTGGVLAGQSGAAANTGRSAYYDGVDDATVIPPLGNTSTSLTLLMWVKRDGNQRGASQMFFCRDTAFTNDAGLGVGSANNLRYHWAGVYWNFAGGTELLLPDREWAMAALVIKPDSGTMVLRTPQGMQSVTNFAPHVLQNFAVPSNIASDPTRDGRQFRGWLDDVQFFRKALTNAELEALWLSGIGGQRSSGLTGTYFRGLNFEDQAFQRIDAAINFNWGEGAPAEGMWADTFSVRWTGCVIPSVTATHNFHLLASTGCRMWVNGQLIINNWTNPVNAEVSGSAALTANTVTPIIVEYYTTVGASRCELSWSAPGLAKQIVPENRLLVNETAFDGEDISALIDPDRFTTSASTQRAIASLPDVESSLEMKLQQGVPFLTYRRPQGMAEQWTLEASADLSTWLPLPASALRIQPLAQGEEQVNLNDARVSLPGQGGAPRRYFRVRAGREP